MANQTKIEWTDFNWNFLRGCSRVSEGCRNCYAESVAARFSGPGQPYEGLAKFVDHKPRWTGEIGYFEDVLMQPLRWTKPRKIFVNSMSDLFHEKVTDEMLDKAFAVMALTPHHTYQILTKRPKRMKEYIATKLNDPGYWGPTLAECSQEFAKNDHEAMGLIRHSRVWPLPNVWLGVSVEDQKTADERIPILLQTPAAVRWISAEPLLGPVDLGRRSTGSGWDEWLTGRMHRGPGVWSGEPKIDWVVVGGESGPGARRCYIEWLRSILFECRLAGVPLFVKQLGSQPRIHIKADAVTVYPISDRKGGNIEDFPLELRVREYPKDYAVTSRGAGTAAA